MGNNKLVFAQLLTKIFYLGVYIFFCGCLVFVWQINKLQCVHEGITDEKLAAISSYVNRIKELTIVSDDENPITLSGIRTLSASIQRLQNPVIMLIISKKIHSIKPIGFENIKNWNLFWKFSNFNLLKLANAAGENEANFLHCFCDAANRAVFLNYHNSVCVDRQQLILLSMPCQPGLSLAKKKTFYENEKLQYKNVVRYKNTRRSRNIIVSWCIFSNFQSETKTVSCRLISEF